MMQRNAADHSLEAAAVAIERAALNVLAAAS